MWLSIHLSLARFVITWCVPLRSAFARASQFVRTSNNTVRSHALWGGPSVLSLHMTNNLARAGGPRPPAQVPGSGGWLAAQAQSWVLCHPRPIFSSSRGLHQASP